MIEQIQWMAAGGALTAVSVVAQAQSTVNVGGYLEQAIYRGFDKVSRVGSLGRSNLAFNGKEGLGDGMSAVFRISTRFEMDTGAPENPFAFWHDEATVGLKSASLGSVRLGRGLTAMWAHDWEFDPWYNFNRIASPAWQFWHYLTPTDRVANGGGPEYGRLNNGIFYDSPTFARVSVHLSTSPEATTGPGGGRSRGVALRWGEGSAAALLAAERNGSGDKVWFLAGKYGFGNATIFAAYDRSEMAGVTPLTANAITLSGAYAIGATTLKAGFGKQDLAGTDKKFYSLGAEYSMSKRATLSLSLGHYTPQPAGTSTAFGLGLTHAF